MFRHARQRLLAWYGTENMIHGTIAEDGAGLLSTIGYTHTGAGSTAAFSDCCTGERRRRWINGSDRSLWVVPSCLFAGHPCSGDRLERTLGQRACRPAIGLQSVRYVHPRNKGSLTSFKRLADLVSVARYAVSCTSSYSWGQLGPFLSSRYILELTVSNSSLNSVLSLAGREAISAERARRVAWSFVAAPIRDNDM